MKKTFSKGYFMGFMAGQCKVRALLEESDQPEQRQPLTDEKIALAMTGYGPIGVGFPALRRITRAVEAAHNIGAEHMKTNIEMANDCQLLDGLYVVPSQVERFAELVRADEREACAKVCDDFESDADPDAGMALAAAIRARGNTSPQPKPQPEQEPVKVGRMADRIKGAVMSQEVMLYTDDYLPVGTTIYTTPPKRQPQPKQPEGDIDFWIRAATEARQAEMKMRREIAKLQPKLQPEQELVQFKCTVVDEHHPNGIPLGQWATPPERPWAGLTDEAILLLLKNCPKEDPEVIGWVTRQKLTWCRAIEAKLKEKNT